MYIVKQNFESLGDPCRSTHDTREAAEAAASELRLDIIDMILDWVGDNERFAPPDTGASGEIEAWENAAHLAYADGAEVAAAAIASAAVKIIYRS